MDLAIGVIIGAAFGAIVSSLVDNILMPLIGLITGGIDLKSLSFSVRDATVQYGMFLQNVVNFLIIAFSVFMIVKVLNRMKRPAQEPETASTMKDCPYCMSSIPILATRCPHCTSELKA